MGLADKSLIGPGNFHPYFDPKGHLSDLAIIFEPLSIRRDVPEKDDPSKLRDELTAQLTIFRSQAELDRGEPNEVKTYVITSKKLVKDLDIVLQDGKKKGDAAPADIKVIGRWSPPDAPKVKVYVLKDAEDADYDKAVAYYEKREAALDDIEF